MPRMTLKAARVNANMTQKEVAEALNVSNKTIGSWEKGITQPKPEQIDMLCTLYGVAYDNLNFLTTNSL